MKKKDGFLPTALFLAALLFAFLAPLPVLAQVEIEGCVANAKGEPLKMVMVKAYEAGGKLPVGYTSTDAGGRYRLRLKSDAPRFTLKFSHVSLKAAEREVERTAGRVDVVMEETSLKLREASVRAPRVRTAGDTISYNVAQLSGEDDRNVEDVLRRIPGVSISDDGAIKYYDKSINKFYIEGLDMLSSNYQIATRNLRPDDIGEIQVLENHDPVKALKDFSFSDRAAINLRIKKRRMLRPIGSLSAGAGVAGGPEAAWSGEGVLFFIGKDRQHSVVAKANNFANDYAGETGTPGAREMLTAVSSLLPANPFGTASVETNRYVEGRAGFGSVNNLFRLSADRTLSVSADYTHGVSDFCDSKQVDYLLDDGRHVRLDEHAASGQRNQRLRARLCYTENSKEKYLQEELSVRAAYGRSLYGLSGTNAVRQRNKLDDYSVTNYLQNTRNRGKRVFDFSSVVAVAHTPSTSFSATDALADTLLVGQEAASFRFYTKEGTGFFWKTSKQTQLQLAVSADALYETLSTETDFYRPLPGNDLRGYRLQANVSLEYSLRLRVGTFRIGLPARMVGMRYLDLLSGRASSLARPYFSPSLSYEKAFGQGSHLSVNTGFSHSQGGIQTLLLQPVYTDYNTSTTMGTGDFTETHSWNSGLDFYVRSIMKGSYLKLQGTFSMVRSDRTADSRIDAECGLSSTTRQLDRSSTYRSWTASATATKNFFDIYTLLSLTTSVEGSANDNLRQGKEMTSRNVGFHLSPSAQNTFFSGVVRTVLTFRYSRLRQRAAGYEEHDNAVSARLRLNVSPAKAVQLHAEATFDYTELGQSEAVKGCFLDGGALWKAGKKWELELRARNLLNRKEYVVRRFAYSDTYTYIYRLRPAECLLSVRWMF